MNADPDPRTDLKGKKRKNFFSSRIFTNMKKLKTFYLKVVAYEKEGGSRVYLIDS